MTVKPLLILSDSISCTSGLGRITRDLAKRIYKQMPDVYRLGTVGYGGIGGNAEFPEYILHSVENWLPQELPLIAKKFAPDEELILLTIWDLSRLRWLADPQQCTSPHIRYWLQTTKMKKWLYHPVDARGPMNGQQSLALAETMKGFDRVLDYTAFSCEVTGNTEHLPHGIETDVFFPRDRREAKEKFRNLGFRGLKDESILIGIIATNQARKDWALGIQTVKILLDRGHDVMLWCHIDVLERFWTMQNLIMDYGLQGRVVITTSNFTDEQMNWFYAACDVTLGIGLGEGMGYPLFESLASGTPVVHGDYGGGAEFLPPSMKVKPIAWRFEGPFCCQRPVFSADDWADCVEDNLGVIASLPNELDWKNLWPKWEEWFRRGAE